MIVGGYELHLYCEVCNVFFEVHGSSRGDTYTAARKKGWLLNHKSRLAYCKKHRPDKEPTP